MSGIISVLAFETSSRLTTSEVGVPGLPSDSRVTTQTACDGEGFHHVPGAQLTLVKWNLPMPIPKELLEILVCPVCKADLELKPDESGLKCTKCKRVYPVRDNIPVMLVDQATIEA